MKINTISVKNEGYIACKSVFYSVQDSISNDSNYTFSTGINKLIGDIDSGNWGISYLLSMYKHQPKDFILFEQPQVIVNSGLISLNELCEYSCYMDKAAPLFSKNTSVKKLIMQGLQHSKSNYSLDDIKNLFHIDSQRFECSLACVGNEIFKAMAAIAFSHNKELFCFPWLSNKRFEYYHENLSVLLQILNDLNKIVIVPIGVS